MEWLQEWIRRVWTLLRRERFQQDLEEEMRFHLELQAEENREEGMNAEAARGAARRGFGNATRLQERSREIWGLVWLEGLGRDLKLALRNLRRNPGFAAVAALTLALGIGAGTAVFSVVNAVLLRPLPFREPHRLAMVWEKWETTGDQRVVVSPDNLDDWRAQSRSFESLAAMRMWSSSIQLGGEPVEIPAWRVGEDFFRALGVHPALGRWFVPEEHRAGRQEVAVLSHGLWQRLGGDPNLPGKTVLLNRKAVTVAGIMPPGFGFPVDCEVWFPLSPDELKDDHSNHFLRVIGRLRGGFSVAQAQTEMKSIAARLALARPETNKGIGATVVPLMDQIVGESRGALLVLLGAVACVLLIACANVANLLLARAAGRRREMALCLALGAGRGRIIRRLLAESLLLSLAGGALGIAAAWWLVRGFVALDPIHLPRVQEIAVDRGVLLFALVASMLTGTLSGIAPALRVSRPDLNHWLPRGAGIPAAGEFRANRGRSVLAAVQIALALVLLVGAGLLMRSFMQRVSVPIGFRPESTLAVELPFSANRGIDQLLERVRALPGVQAAGAGTARPYEPAPLSCDRCLEIEGRPAAGGGSRDTGFFVVTADYLRAAGLALQRGRALNAGDGAKAPKVAAINEALARRDFPGQDPIGRHLRWSGGDWLTVVGVTGNAKGFGVDHDPLPALYVPNLQASWPNGVFLLVRTVVPPASLAGAVRREIRSWNRRLTIGKLDTIEGLMSQSVAVPRFYMLLLAGFAALALLVAAIGIYGTLNYSVAQRTHEIGVRMALGAERGDVLAMILRHGLAVTAAGVALGLAGAWFAARLLRSMLFGVEPADFTAFAGAAAVLGAIGILACYIPARRATRVDPVTALRWE